MCFRGGGVDTILCVCVCGASDLHIELGLFVTAPPASSPPLLPS